MVKTKMNLKRLRERIDKIDQAILTLLNRRASIVLEVGRIKKERGMSPFAPGREKQIIERLVKANSGPFPEEALKAVFREILSGSLSLEGRLKIAYLGPEATFTHLAAIRKFGSLAEYVPLKSISDVFREVEKGCCHYGVVPIENSTEGVINHTLDMFVDSELKICSEILIEISHNLLSKYKLEEIKKVYSHPQALAQARIWIENNLHNVELVEVSSTAKAAELASREPFSGAIASELAAKIYGLKVVSSHIEDNPHNYTRFLVIGETLATRSGKDKTSIMCSIRDRVGALYSMLKPFYKHRINLTSIESRPSRRKAWDYYFFIDLEGHLEEGRVKKALRELEQECLSLKVLGSYPVSS